MSTKNSDNPKSPPIIGGRVVISCNGEKPLPRCIECYANSEEGLKFLSYFRPLNKNKWNPEKTKEKFIQLEGLEENLNNCGHPIKLIDENSLWKYLNYCYSVRNMFSIYTYSYITYESNLS